jgi:hypothetical protein
MKRNSNVTTREVRAMKKIINIMICLTVMNSFVALGEDTSQKLGKYRIGVKYQYTNNSTIAETPSNFFETNN